MKSAEQCAHWFQKLKLCLKNKKQKNHKKTQNLKNAHQCARQKKMKNMKNALDHKKFENVQQCARRKKLKNVKNAVDHKYVKMRSNAPVG